MTKAPATPKNKLAVLGLLRDIDLALHLPMRYEDETTIVDIVELQAAVGSGDTLQIQATVSDNEVAYRPRRQLIVRLRDDTGELVLRFLNFYGSQVQQLAIGNVVRARGEPRDGFFGIEMVHPAYKVIKGEEPLPTTLTPVYHASAGISQAYLRKAIAGALERIAVQRLLPEILPERVLRSLPGTLRAWNLQEAITVLHHPGIEMNASALMERSHPAWARIKFEELLAQQLSLKRAQLNRRSKRAPSMAHPASANGTIPSLPRPPAEGWGEGRHESKSAPPTAATRRHNISLIERFEATLPFTLTNAQQRVWQEIAQDMAAPFPMQRLLQGDVGSGKTIVAALAACLAMSHGYQAALMAPTEILAEQHYKKLQGWLAPLGVQIAWLTSSLKAKDKRAALAAIETGVAHLVIGTHAVIQDSVTFAELGLAIVDEQHRFGVAQRLALRNKGASPSTISQTPTFLPHQLMMSATPIPRTLAMTYYADLNVSTLDELPPGRTPVLTKLVTQARRHEVIARVRDAVAQGRQVYWVCPLIEESEALQLKTAVETFESLTTELTDIQIGLVHGKLKTDEKAATMLAFSQNQIQVLVATTVIEVGVDVPNASLMVIEHAERFGLAQLHQLRGRVGRGAAESVCVLLYQNPLSPTAKQRLRTMYDTTDGFEIARRDLDIRGPGEFLGARQSGLAMLRFADLNTDLDLIDIARQTADTLLEHHPDIVEAHLERWIGAREEFLKV